MSTREVRTTPSIGVVTWAVVATLAWVGPLHAGLEDRAYVIAYDELKVIDETSFSLVEGVVPLPNEHLVSWWNTLDQKRLAFVTQKKAKLPAKLTVVDLEKLQVVDTVELSLAPSATIRSESGRRGYILHGGREKKDVQPTLLAVDAVEASVTASVELSEQPAHIFLYPDESRIGLVYYGFSASKLDRRVPARFDVHDSVTLERLASLKLPGPVTRIWINRVYNLIYLVDTGVDKKRPEKSVAGRVYVLDPEKVELKANLEVGVAPGPLTWDAVNRRYYLLTQPRKSKTAVAALQSIERAEITARLELPMEPLGVSPSADRSRFYIMDKGGITIAKGDLSGLGRRVELGKTPGNVLQHRDSSIGLVLHPTSNTVTRVDFSKLRVMDDFVSGRTSKRVGKGFAIAGAILVSAAANAYYSSASPYSGHYYYYQPVIIPYSGYVGAKTSGVFSEDGRFAYIFNAGTADVTVYDMQRERVARKMPGGQYGIYFVDGNDKLVTLGTANLRLFDTEQHEQLLETGCDGITGCLVVHPDDVHAYMWSYRKSLKLVNFRTRKVEKEFPGLRGKVIRLRTEDDIVLEEVQARLD